MNTKEYGSMPLWDADVAKRFSSRRGFTLIELLVVIMVVGLLMVLIIPALKSARSSAESTQCLANLRRIGQAVFLYTGENRGKMMPYSTGDTNGNVSGYWLSLLAPYMSSPKDPSYVYSAGFICPADKRPRNPSLSQRFYTDYGLAGLNGILFGVHNPDTGINRFSGYLSDRAPNFATIPQLSKAMMVSDIDFVYAWGSADIDDVSLQSWRHGNGINCVFADGHVERRKKSEVPTDPQDVFWNGGNPNPVPL